MTANTRMKGGKVRRVALRDLCAKFGAPREIRRELRLPALMKAGGQQSLPETDPLLDATAVGGLSMCENSGDSPRFHSRQAGSPIASGSPLSSA